MSVVLSRLLRAMLSCFVKVKASGASGFMSARFTKLIKLSVSFLLMTTRVSRCPLRSMTS